MYRLSSDSVVSRQSSRYAAPVRPHARFTLARIALLALLIACLLPAANLVAQDTEPQETALNGAPKLNKEQEKSLDKGARNALKHCSSGDTVKHRGEISQGCLDLAAPLRNEAHFPEGARAALQRSCSLGNPGGCNELGKDLAAGGDISSARIAWTAGPCANATICKVSLFDSYADDQPPNVAAAEQVGLPLCDQGNDDRVCHRLAEIGSKADFAAIAQHHKDAQIADLNNRINKNTLSIPLLQAQVSLCQVNANNATGFAALLAAGELKLAQKELEQAQKDDVTMHQQLEQLMASQ